MANWKEVEITDSGKIALNRVNSGNSAYRLKITRATFNTKSGNAVQEAESLDWHDVQPFLDENGEEITDSLSYVLDIFLNNKSEILADSGLESGAEQYELGSVSIYGTLYRVNETGDETAELTDELLTLRVKDGESGDLIPIGEGSPALYAKYTIRFSINSSTTGGRIYVTPKVISVDEFNRYKKTLNGAVSDIVDLSANKLEVVVVDKLPSKQSTFILDNLVGDTSSTNTIYNNSLPVYKPEEGAKVITANSRFGTNTYAGATSDFRKNISDIENSKLLVVSMSFKMSEGSRWHINLIDREKRGTNANGSYANNLSTANMAVSLGNIKGDYLGINGNTLVPDKELWANKWLHIVFECNSDTKKVKYKLTDKESGETIIEGEVDYSDTTVSSVTGIEFYTWVASAKLLISGINLTANYADVSKSVVYVVNKNSEYTPYLYVNNVPILLTDSESIESLLNSSKVLGSDIEILKESSHSHSNKSALDLISRADDMLNINKLHILDAIGVGVQPTISLNRTSLSALLSNSHTHDNKTVLDGISSTDIANWDAKVDTDDLPNIRKNPSSTSGDIIDTHLTIGSRMGTAGINSFAQGSSVTASGNYSHAEGGGTIAKAECSHAEGSSTSASGVGSHSEGNTTYATNTGAHSEGSFTTASGHCSHTEGNYTTASGNNSHAEGDYTTASGDSSHAEGHFTTALAYQHVQGHYNKNGTAGAATGTTGDAFIIGNGNSNTARSNAFRVTYSGSVYGAGAYNSTGADIAELYEWLDGNPDNEDRRGLFVTLDGAKIKLAEPTDTYIKGVISAAPALVGDSYSDTWHGMYLTDVFGVPLKQIVHHEAEYTEVKKTDPETGEEITEQVLLHDEYDAEEYILNPDYDPEQEYIPREQRQEYDYVSSWGKLVLVDDGTCEVNGFATVGEGGKATKSDTQTIYRVMERKDDAHIFVAIG